MTDEAIAANGTLDVSHHICWLGDFRLTPQTPFLFENGLIVVQPGLAIISTGIHSGVVDISVEARTNPPEEVDIELWDEVIEASIEAPIGQVIVRSWIGNPDLPPLTVTGPGIYRVRIHARGRDTMIDGTAFEPVEHYLVIMWPDKPGPEVVYKQSDEYGASMRVAAIRDREILSRSKPPAPPPRKIPSAPDAE